MRMMAGVPWGRCRPEVLRRPACRRYRPASGVLATSNGTPLAWTQLEPTPAATTRQRSVHVWIWPETETTIPPPDTNTPWKGKILGETVRRARRPARGRRTPGARPGPGPWRQWPQTTDSPALTPCPAHSTARALGCQVGAGPAGCRARRLARLLTPAHTAYAC